MAQGTEDWEAQWADLHDRLTRAARTLEERADGAGEDDAPRLRGKESGVRLALSYMDDYRDEVSRVSGDPQPDAIERLSAAVAAITPCSCSAQRARADEWAAKWKERGVLLHEMRKALAAAEAESAYHLSLLDGETALALVKARAEASR